ncbi:MAG: ABC transporter ATP-binding protein [Planctomycetota bacterium]
MTGFPLLEARAASLSYPGAPAPAVDNANLAVMRGECVAIIGSSGSGKSTLLALLAGLCRPGSGEALFEGRPWKSLGPAETYRIRSARMGLLLQEGGLLPGLTALDNVTLPAVLAGFPPADAARRAMDRLAAVGLADRARSHPNQLSQGQARRVALARALVADPLVILADEPTSNLDPGSSREIIALLAGIREQRSAAIVIVTHDAELAAIADRTFRMEDGRCLAHETARPAADPGASVPWQGRPREAVEPSPPFAQVPSTPKPVPTGIGEAAALWLPFVGGACLAAGAVALLDGLLAWRQETVVRSEKAQRRLAEEMALQDLRADVDDVTLDSDGLATATLFMQNFRPDRTLHVLGPAVDVGIQREGRWQAVSVRGNDPGGTVRPVGADKILVRFRFPVPDLPHDELLPGYLHVRIAASMVVADRPDGSGDLFERQDSYYVYLRDPRKTAGWIRSANRWGDKAPVPVWISMPSH